MILCDPLGGRPFLGFQMTEGRDDLRDVLPSVHAAELLLRLDNGALTQRTTIVPLRQRFTFLE